MRLRGVFTIALILGISLLVAKLNCRVNFDPVITRYFDWVETVHSFQADSDLFNFDRKLIGKTIFNFQDPDRWEMIIEDNGLEQAHWIKIGKTTYVKDFTDQRWWQVDNNLSKLTSSIDFRDFANRARRELNKIKFVFQTEEACGESLCLIYLVLNPDYESSREHVRQTIWLDSTSSALVKEEYVGDTGIAVTEYSHFNQLTLVAPGKIKLAKPDNLFLLPGSVEATYSAKMSQWYPLVFPFAPVR